MNMEEKKMVDYSTENSDGRILIKDIEIELHDVDLSGKISQVEVGTAWPKC